MKKEEILEASRNENKNKDLAEMENESKAARIASIGIILLATVYFVMEIFVKGETNYGWYSIIALFNAILYGYKTIKGEKKPIYIINVLLWGFAAITLITLYITKIYQTSNIM